MPTSQVVASDAELSWWQRHRATILIAAVFLLILVGVVEFSVALLLRARVPTQKGELSALLFGASSIALILYSLVITTLGIVGWGVVQTTIKSEVTAKVEQEIRQVRQEISGRHFSGMGWIVGRLSYNREDFTVSDPPRLADAVDYCRLALPHLDDPALVGHRFSLMNNLVFFLTLQGNDAEGEFVLAEAAKLEEQGWKTKNTTFILTACGAILRYSRDPWKRHSATAKLLDLRNSTRYTQDEQREATRYLEY